jgi:ABC-type protease/lipase transport system fused ATPase/permease subunit
MTTRTDSFINANDYVLIMEKGVATEFGSFEELKGQVSSAVHRFSKEENPYPFSAYATPPFFFGSRVTDVQMGW